VVETAGQTSNRVQDLGKLLTASEKEIVEYFRKELRKNGSAKVVSLCAEVVSLICAIRKANSLVVALNKPVVFSLDVIHCTTESAERINKGLNWSGPPNSVDAFGLHKGTPLHAIPLLLELAAREPKVVVRVSSSCTPANQIMTPADFQEVLKEAQLAYAKLKVAPGEEESGMLQPQMEPFFIHSQDVPVGRSDVYLSPLLEHSRLKGVFPIMSTLDGACIGSLTVLLEATPGVFVEGMSGYKVVLEVTHFEVDSAYTKIVDRGLVGHYENEPGPKLFLHYKFFGEAFTDSIDVRKLSAEHRGIVGRKTIQQTTYVMQYKKDIPVAEVSGPFLKYLATDALRFELVISSDPSLVNVLQRYEDNPEVNNNRHNSLLNIHCLDTLSRASLEEGDSPEMGMDTGRMHGGFGMEQDDLASLNGLESASVRSRCSRLTTRRSMRLSSFLSEYGTSLLLHAAVDVLEPITEQAPNGSQVERFVPVDIKKPRVKSNGVGVFKTIFGRRTRDNAMNATHTNDCFSEVDSVATFAGAIDGGSPVFHIISDHKIRTRRLKIVVEQVHPLKSAKLESCVSVMATAVMNILSPNDFFSLQELGWEQSLPVLVVTRSSCQRRLEITVELPRSDAFYRQSGRGHRLGLLLQIGIQLEGFLVPALIKREVLFKVIASERKTSLMYRLRQSVRTQGRERLHKLGFYYAIRTHTSPHLMDAVKDFVDFKLTCHTKLLHRLMLCRQYQATNLPAEPTKMAPGPGKFGRGERQEVALSEGWRAKLNSPRADKAREREHIIFRDDQETEGDEVDTQQSITTYGSGNYYDTQYLDNNVQKILSQPARGSIHLTRKENTITAIFGVTVEKKRRSLRLGHHGVYEEEDTKPSFTYNPAAPAQLAMDAWTEVAYLEVHEVQDYPTEREGYLNIRAGLLESGWVRAWFVFRRPFLFHYSRKGDARPADVMYMTDCKVSCQNREELDLLLKAPGKVWGLQAASDEDLVAWLEKLIPVNSSDLLQ
jgi:hypothetical protein